MRFCRAITVTDYHFTWCSVVVNAIFNTCFGSITCYVGKFYFRVFLIFVLNYFGRFFLQMMNYRGF
jgi:hypothetical protein